MNLMDRLNELYAVVDNVSRAKEEAKKIKQPLRDLEQEAIKSIYEFASENFEFLGGRDKSYFFDETKKTGLYHWKNRNFGDGIRIYRYIEPEDFREYVRHKNRDDFWGTVAVAGLVSIIGIPLTIPAGLTSHYHFEKAEFFIKKAKELSGRDAILYMLDEYNID